MSVIITLKLLSLVSKIPMHACLIASLSAAYIYDSTPTITKNEVKQQGKQPHWCQKYGILGDQSYEFVTTCMSAYELKFPPTT